MACLPPPPRARTSRLALCSAAGLLFLAVGCGAPRVNLSEGAREYVATDYERVRAHWTRNSELLVMRELDNVLNVTATYEAWDFRWAYAVRYASDYRLSVEQRRVLLERTLSESRAHHQFYVALFAENHKWADLTQDDPAWVVRMIDDLGNETPPSEVIPIERPGAVERTYFPYTTPWRRAYRLRFPTRRPDGGLTIALEAKHFGLRFAGAQGNQQLVWELEGR